MESNLNNEENPENKKNQEKNHENNENKENNENNKNKENNEINENNENNEIHVNNENNENNEIHENHENNEIHENEENICFDDKENEYWLICPFCKIRIPLIHLFIFSEVNDNNGVKNIDDILYADIKCKTCQPITIPLEIYLNFIKKNGKMIKPDIIDSKFKNKEFNEDKNIIYCMDQHGFIDYKHYMMHNVIKFKISHVTCEKELNIDSYCQLNQNHEYYKKGKYFCQFCNLALCKSCKNYHEINQKSKNHPISELENETILIENIFNEFKQNIKNLNENYKKLKINELIIQYVYLLKNNYDRISNKHIPNYYLINNFKLLHQMEKDDKYLINSKAYSLNYYFENIISLNKNNLHILKLDEINNNNHYSFLLYSNDIIYLCSYHNSIFKKIDIKRKSGESNSGILKKINEDNYYIFINNEKKNEYSFSINLNENKFEKYSISKSDYCSSYFNISSLDNMIGGVTEGKIRILNIDNQNHKLKNECSIDIKKQKEKILEAIYINKFPYKSFNFEEVKKENISEEEIEVIIYSTDKDYLGIIYLKKSPQKNNKLKIELELLWKLNLKKSPIKSNDNNENIIKCICALDKGFCFATEENKYGYLYVYNEVLLIDKDKEQVFKKCDNKIKIGFPIKCMCKTECNYILVTVDNISVIKFWDLRYLTCINVFQVKGNTEEIPNIIKIIFVKNNDDKKYYDIIMVTGNNEILIYRSNFKKILESNSNIDEEEFAFE